MAGSHPSQYEHALADETTYEGKAVAELRSVAPRTDGFGTLMQTFSAEHFLGQRVRFSGALKCEGVENRVGLWMRVYGPQRQMLAFDNMAGRRVSGTTDWRRYEVVLDVPAEAKAIALGVRASRATSEPRLLRAADQRRREALRGGVCSSLPGSRRFTPTRRGRTAGRCSFATLG